LEIRPLNGQKLPYVYNIIYIDIFSEISIKFDNIITFMYNSNIFMLYGEYIAITA